MFSFHKPRVYRSSEGCCICRAKTSSSRFIESKKYERDAMKCFLLEEPRKGEICNACVLLVKRYKRLPAGSNKNWGHVVDARCGTSTKSQKNTNNATAKVANTQNGSNNSTSRCLLPEKFAKIFKKNKKVKSSKKCELNGNKRKIVNNNYDITGSCLPTTPDSIDSDCEDGHYTAPTNLQTGTYVEFQTETRASSYRTRKNSTLSSCVKSENSCVNNGRRRTLEKLGSKRRKCFTPHKRVNALDSEKKVQFFDEKDWKKRKTCCGIIYECAVLSNALLINQEDYCPCDEHKQLKHKTKAVAVQKPIATLPAVVQIQATTKPTNSSMNTTITPSCINTKSSTPVLKKHHLFFKRQSESFPHSDINNSNNNTNNSSSTFHTKTETVAQNSNVISAITTPPITTSAATTASSISCNKSTSIISSSTTPYVNNINNLLMSSSTTLSLANTTSSNTFTTTPFNYMPKHSSAKVTTISTPLTACVSSLPMQTTKSQHFLHKIKADTGKIVKHSMEKINTAVRIKPIDMQEMKHVIKTVEKSYVLAKPTTITPINCTSNAIATSNNSSQLHQYPHGLPQTLTAATIAAGASSPSALSSSSTSSTSTKFSDNSSDSGFDENTLDRKSASPLQEDTERKIITRSGVQTMFLSSGVQIQGQHQNLVLTGNEVAAKIIQNRRTATNTSTITVQPVTVAASSTSAVPATTMHHHQQYTNNNRATSTATTSSVKIAQIIGGVNGNLTGGSHVAKMRAIYNNNTIQHENGVTTIVPASSLAATTQTAAMNAIAPSTVTITPAPIQPTTNTNNNLNGKKVLTTNNIISLNGGTLNGGIVNKGNNNNDYHNQNVQSIIAKNNLTAATAAAATHINVYNQQQHHLQHHQQHQQHQNHHYHHQQNQQNTNQKIILLKTTPNMARSTTAKYNNNTTQNIMNKALLTTTQSIATMPQNLNATANIIKTRP